ncbi:hypothetical protein BJ322DRAFT_385416 [Thelephora terrestris]|uniref:Ubiquitin carboxyl-terminal hydrolase n=1 Tax=Thelephora terrestris TaxID=56493 RepID=A0A9P6HNF6_9AGAM|nr:hypothetical protein BJ322DRAFT_385416 [Thelephora terrestris]
MASIPVTIKHSGKTYSLTLNASQPPQAFKETIYQSTGIPVDRMKVIFKGRTIMDDDWGKIALKADMSFVVLGTAGELPKPPETKTVFLEDMDDKELAEALAYPVGLKNLGNTCYMNSTVQMLRAIPELQTTLTSSSTSGLPAHLGQLYNSMSRTPDAYIPQQFLTSLRQAFPQFAELISGGGGGIRGPAYAQQDAEECYSQIVANALRDVPGPSGKKFVEAYMMTRLRNELKCDEAPDEPATVSTEEALKVGCHISMRTNFMQPGIKEALDQKVTKHSPTLNRDASYSQHSRLERLPMYLTVHMVRFAWKSDISKKVKIMRRVNFPTEYDALEIVTDELKAKLQPVSRRLMEIEKERMERCKVRKRMKNKASTSQTAAPSEPTDATEGGEMDVDKKPEDGGDLQDEAVYRKKELEELEALISPDIKADTGASPTGLYELVAIITHKGAAADAGHYVGFVKRSAFHPRASEAARPGQRTIDDEDNDWYKFDDDKVSIFPEEKLATLGGGGEDASAYVLLYKTKPLA